MNQGKLEVVKQDMARVNVDILGISELKWTGMDEINSDDHYIYYWARILKWFAIPFSSRPHFVRILHHDPPVLGGPTWHGLVSVS